MTELDDIWANEGGVSVRVLMTDKGELRIEFTRGVGGRAEHVATLAGYRAYRLGQVLTKTWPKPEAARVSKPDCSCPGREFGGHNDGCPRKEAKSWA